MPTRSGRERGLAPNPNGASCRAHAERTLHFPRSSHPGCDSELETRDLETDDGVMAALWAQSHIRGEITTSRLTPTTRLSCPLRLRVALAHGSVGCSNAGNVRAYGTTTPIRRARGRSRALWRWRRSRTSARRPARRPGYRNALENGGRRRSRGRSEPAWNATLGSMPR